MRGWNQLSCSVLRWGVNSCCACQHLIIVTAQSDCPPAPTGNFPGLSRARTHQRRMYCNCLMQPRSFLTQYALPPSRHHRRMCACCRRPWTYVALAWTFTWSPTPARRAAWRTACLLLTYVPLAHRGAFICSIPAVHPLPPPPRRCCPSGAPTCLPCSRYFACPALHAPLGNRVARRTVPPQHELQRLCRGCSL